MKYRSFAERLARKEKRKEKALQIFGQKRVKKRRTKSERKRLVDEADKLFSLYIRLRDKRKNAGRCLICRKNPIEVCYHLIPRGRYITRWDPSAAVGGCPPCNFGEKMNRLLYRQKHIDIFGKDFYEALEEKSRQLAKFSVDDLRNMVAEIRVKLEGVCKETA